MTTDISRQTCRINGQAVGANDLSRLPELLQPTGEDGRFLAELAAFLNEWFSPTTTVTVHTSGSTGLPKELQVEKQRMMNSARQTLEFLSLHEGQTALLCMPLRYIAGKMVVVRALTGGLDLLPVTPCGHPLAGLDTAPDFAALIPMQVYNSLQASREADLLRQTKHLIIGGGAIDADLGHALADFPNAVWSTYGMTETLSHIALRRLNGSSASDWYTPLSGVDLSLSDEGTLVINAPAVCKEPLVTNDLALLNRQGQFRILGRRDNTINTGGIKVQIEEVEAALRPLLAARFLITSAPDPKFGERIVLLLERQPATDGTTMAGALASLPPYWRPKQTIEVERIPLTGTGKPDRAAARQVAQAASAARS